MTTGEIGGQVELVLGRAQVGVHRILDLVAAVDAQHGLVQALLRRVRLPAVHVAHAKLNETQMIRGYL